MTCDKTEAGFFLGYILEQSLEIVGTEALTFWFGFFYKYLKTTNILPSRENFTKPQQQKSS